ncbi:MAG: hypothetical protein HY270_22620, partial [Deltaproteobacteria bacterium]|nr:hypothetical protein [Deltaproteobacteria bacterium]
MRRSLRLRLLLWLLCVVVPLTVAAGWLLTQVFGQRLVRDVDVAVQEEAETVAELVSVSATPDALGDLLAKISGETELGASKYVVVSRAGRVVAEAPHGARDLVHDDSRQLHVVRYAPPAGDVLVEIAVRETVARHATQRLRSLLLLGVPLFVALVAIGLWVVIGRELRPLEQAAQGLDRIGVDDLGARLDGGGRNDEV